MKPDLRSLIVLGLFAVVAAWFAASWSGAARGEQAPPEPGSVEAAKTDAVAKTGAAAKTDAAKGGAAETTPAAGKGTWETVRGYAIGFVTYPLTIAMVLIIISYALGRVLSRRLRMPDFSWKIGLVAFTVIASAFISWAGIHNAILRAQRGKPSGPELKFGIDLRGGVNLTYQIKKTEGDTKTDANALIDALRKRIDPTGTKQIVVRLSGADQVDIVVPAVNEDEIAEIKRNVTDLGTLEFRILANRRSNEHLELGRIAVDPEQTPATKISVRRDEKELTERRDELRKVQSARALTDAEQKELATIERDLATPEARWVPLDPEIVRQYYDSQKDADGANRGPLEYSAGMFTRAIQGGEVLKNASINDLLERDDKGGETYKEGYRAEILVYQDPYNVEGGFLSGISAGFDEKAKPAVNFAFDTEGSSRFTRLTTDFQPPSSNDNYRWHLAVLLNGKVTSAPSLNSVISGRGQITGYNNDDRGRKERDRVVAVLKAGQLPAQLDEQPLSEVRMDATLGIDTIQKSVWSMVVALGLLFAFMLVYYRFSGMVACIALLLNTLMLIASMIAIDAALTLPGFAGMVLTVGMAVDSNVLIYERMREELARGAALRMAIRNGFGKALSAIVDSNITTIITGLILYAIGTEDLKGFAVTLVLGLTISMYTAVFCSRLLFDIAERRRWLTDVKMLKFFEKTNYDFLRVKWWALGFSWVIILAGAVAVVARGKGLLDIDFTGGTAAQVVFKDDEALKVADIRQQLEEWNVTIDNAKTAGSLRSALELPTEPKTKLLRTLEVELMARLVKEGKRDDFTLDGIKLTSSDIEWIRQKHRLGALTQADELRLADYYARLDKFDELYGSLDERERDELRQLARLEDLTVTVTTVPVTDAEGNSRNQQRPYINTSNSSAAAVEGILEKVFEGRLASNGFRSEPKLVEARKTAEKGPPPESEKTPAAGTSAKESKTEPGKTAPAKTEKTEPAKTEPAKTEPAKTEPAKTEPAKGKTEGGKTEGGKTVPPKTSDLAPPADIDPVGAMYAGFVADDAGLLLAQADSPGKTTEAKPAAKDGPAEASTKAPGAKSADAEGTAGLLTATDFEVTFLDKINHDTVLSAVRRAARNQTPPLSDAAIEAITAKNPLYDATVNQGFVTWTITINAPEKTARAVLDRANRLIEAQPFFPASKNIGPLVSTAMSWKAIVAVVASWIAMLVYLWIRFQRVSFGLGAVVALVHDSLVALAFMAFSYWMTGIPTIDPFKINLVVVAAFLTLIGYSVNDTIVIFDRIREIKGKSPELTAGMVNRAVNETLSRTIITAGLTFLVVLAQYFFGGASIHAFAYCLVVGLIIGTYSSVYIASPVMLWANNWGHKHRRATAPARESQMAEGR